GIRHHPGVGPAALDATATPDRRAAELHQLSKAAIEAAQLPKGAPELQHPGNADQRQPDAVILQPLSLPSHLCIRVTDGRRGNYYPAVRPCQGLFRRQRESAKTGDRARRNYGLGRRARTPAAWAARIRCGSRAMKAIAPHLVHMVPSISVSIDGMPGSR